MVVNGKEATSAEWQKMMELYREHMVRGNGRGKPSFSLKAGGWTASKTFQNGREALLFIGKITSWTAAKLPKMGDLKRFVKIYRAIIAPGSTNHTIHLDWLRHYEIRLESGEEFARFFTEVSEMAA